MKKKRLVPLPVERLELTPMIDVTFLLLVFFLLTLRFKTLEGKLEATLPRDAGVRATQRSICCPVEVIVRVPEERAGERVYASGPDAGEPWDPASGRRFRFVGRAPQYTLGPRRTGDLEELTGWMRNLWRKDPAAPLHLRARGGTVYGDVVPVLDAAVAAGFASVRFAGELD